MKTMERNYQILGLESLILSNYRGASGRIETLNRIISTNLKETRDTDEECCPDITLSSKLAKWSSSRQVCPPRPLLVLWLT
jgi:hypothetical protein